MSGDIPPLPNTPSWRDAPLKHRDNFTFTLSGNLSSVNLALYIPVIPSPWSGRQDLTFFCSPALSGGL